MLVTVIIVALLAYVNHVAWQLHKKGDYDKAALWFCGMLLFWWAVIGATFGPIAVTEEQTITAPASWYFTVVYFGGVVGASVMAMAEWSGNNNISYKLMFLLLGILPVALLIRLADVADAIKQTNVGG